MHPISFDITPAQTIIDALAGDKWAGQLIASEWGDGLFVYRLLVEPQFRGPGVATGLIEKAKELASGRPIYLRPSAFADSPVDTAQLAAWYRRLGFVDAGEAINSQITDDTMSPVLRSPA